MRVSVGDRVTIHGRSVGMPDHSGEVIEVRGEGDDPLLVVRYDDGHQSILSRGSDCEIHHVA
ncbi:DUF1918 domain-containing protein [Microbacterium deminutum]|uniref:DUF1918 domain-containing protein n=1 Tax=Microbacterium deminutum TaxID=344164 RepID=A0ABN2R073_9MICO